MGGEVGEHKTTIRNVETSKVITFSHRTYMSGFEGQGRCEHKASSARPIVISASAHKPPSLPQSTSCEVHNQRQHQRFTKSNSGHSKTGMSMGITEHSSTRGYDVSIKRTSRQMFHKKIYHNWTPMSSRSKSSFVNLNNSSCLASSSAAFAC